MQVEHVSYTPALVMLVIAAGGLICLLCFVLLGLKLLFSQNRRVVGFTILGVIAALVGGFAVLCFVWYMSASDMRRISSRKTTTSVHVMDVPEQPRIQFHPSPAHSVGSDEVALATAVETTHEAEVSGDFYYENNDASLTNADASQGEHESTSERADGATYSAATKTPDWVIHPPEQVNGRLAKVVSSAGLARMTGDDYDHEEARSVCAQMATAYLNSRGIYRNINYRYINMSNKLVEAARRDTFVEVQDSRYIYYQLLVFDQKFERAVNSEVRRSQVEERLRVAGGLYGFALLSVTCFFGSASFLHRRNQKKLAKQDSLQT